MKKKICLIPNFGLARTNSHHYGIPKADNTLVQKLCQAGFEVDIVGQVISSEDKFLDTVVDHNNMRCHAFGRDHDHQARLGKTLNYCLAFFALCRFLFQQPKSTLVYIYFPGNIGLIASLLCVIQRKHYALYVRGSWNHRRANRLLSGFIFKHANWVLTTGSGFCRSVEAHNKDVNPVSPMIAIKPNAVLERDYAVDETIELLFVGHLKESKGVYEILAATQQLKSKGYHLRLTLLGGGNPDDIDKLNLRIQHLSIEDEVNYIGHISEADKIHAIYQQADIFVYPSYFAEGFPRVVYEAMLNGLPICCTILEGMKGFMKDDRNCVEVESAHLNLLPEKLEVLIEDEDRRKRIGKKAYEDITNYLVQFQNQDHAAQVIDRFNGLVTSS